MFAGRSNATANDRGRFRTGLAPGNREDSRSVLRVTERKSRKVKTMITMKLGLLSAGFILGAASLVEAQQLQNCAPREKVVARLADKYGETRQP